MSIVNRSQVPSNEVVLTGGVYTLRVKKSEVAVSRGSGNRQIVLLTEIVAPTTIQVGDRDLNIQGIEHTYYLGLSQQENRGGRVPIADTLDVYEKLGLGSEVDDEAPELGVFEGLYFKAVLESKERVLTNAKGDAILENGKKVTNGWQIVGFSSGIVTRVDPATL